MVENKSIDDKTWYVTNAVGDITTELNTLFRAKKGYKIHEANTVFHCILTTDEQRHVELHFTYNKDLDYLNNLLNNNVRRSPGPSPLSNWLKNNKNNKAYGINYDPNAKISAPSTSDENTTINVDPINTAGSGTEFRAAVEKLRESEHPRLLSLVIGKYHTDEEQTAMSNNNQTRDDDPLNNPTLSSQISKKFFESVKYGRCRDSCYGELKYIVQPIELCSYEYILSRNKAAIGAYKSLAPKASDVSIVEYDADVAISEIVYQTLPPEIVYRTSINPFTNRNGKSTIILVGEYVNSVLGTKKEV